MTCLNQANTDDIATRIPCPEYNRSDLKTGIVHIGVGGFHRSHQAYYIHQLLTTSDSHEWGICGVGLREADRQMHEVLTKQDGLYTLIIQHPDGEVTSEVIGSIKEMLLAVDDPGLVLDKLAHADTKIVSLTITEGGYNFHPQSGEFNFENEDVKHELAHPDEPRTVYGYLAEALSMRRARGQAPFTILSCDNIPGNGDVTRRMLLAFAKQRDPALATWIEKEVAFPNTMVDRITPVTGPADQEYLETTYQVSDEWPVICEPFIQWVVEDNFSDGRPPLERLGVQFVPDVIPYEKMKIRLLNAGHSVLGIPGAIHGHSTINDCMRDEVFASFMRRFMDEEATPVLDPIDGIDLHQYKDSLETRFSNPNIADHVSRICSESSAKLPKFIIPTIQDNLKVGGSIRFATFILAAWCFYSDKEANEAGEALDIIDLKQVELHEAAKRTADDPLGFIGLQEIFGDLSSNERFATLYSEIIRSIYQANDIRRLMRAMIAG